MESIISFILNRLLIFLLLGVATSLCQEAIADFLGARAIYLARGLRSLLGHSKLADGTLIIKKLYNHGLIHSLYIDSGLEKPRSRFLHKLLKLPTLEQTEGSFDTVRLPFYIPSRVFATTMIDILNQDKLNGKATLVNIESELFSMRGRAESRDSDRLAECLISMLVEAASKESALLAFQQDLEGWFDSTMDQVSAWYKRFAERGLIISGLLLAFIFNVDAIRVVRVQSGNADLNQAIQSAQDLYLKDYLKSNAPKESNKDGVISQDALRVERELFVLENLAINARLEASQRLRAVFGWQYSLRDYEAIWTHPGTWSIAHLLNEAAGWLITAYASSLFARFWFDFSRKLTISWTSRKEAGSQN